MIQRKLSSSVPSSRRLEVLHGLTEGSEPEYRNICPHSSATYFGRSFLGWIDADQTDRSFQELTKIFEMYTKNTCEHEYSADPRPIFFN